MTIRVIKEIIHLKMVDLAHCGNIHSVKNHKQRESGPSLERVPRVPGTRDILSSYLMAPVNFSEISG